jgi:hypothetical protein
MTRITAQTIEFKNIFRLHSVCVYKYLKYPTVAVFPRAEEAVPIKSVPAESEVTRAGDRA